MATIMLCGKQPQAQWLKAITLYPVALEVPWGSFASFCRSLGLSPHIGLSPPKGLVPLGVMDLFLSG